MTYVRRAVEADLGTLLPLCRQFHAESPVHRALAFSDAKVEQLIRGAMESDDWLAAVACDDSGAIVGMMLLYCLGSFFSDELEVGDLTFYVTPAARGGKAAFKMMNEALYWTKLKRAARIQIGVTTGINEPQAARFFGKYGFESAGVLLQRSIDLSD